MTGVEQSPHAPIHFPENGRMRWARCKRRTSFSIFLAALCALHTSAQSQSISWSPEGDRLVHSLNFNLTVVEVNAMRSTEIGRGWAPQWSPSSDQILFILSGRVFLVNADGSDRRSAGTGETPVWSPEGSRFAFSTRKQVEYEDEQLNAMIVHVADATGDNMREAFEVWGDFIEPLDIYAWWPMGIAYEVWNLIPQGTSGGLIDLKKRSHVDSRVRNPDEKFNPGWPLKYKGMWSPESGRLVFAVYKWDPKYREIHFYLDFGIHTIDLSLDPNNWEYHATTTKLINVEPASLPSWSPDGKNLVFAVNTEGDNQDIFMVGADGTDLTRVTHSEEKKAHPG